MKKFMRIIFVLLIILFTNNLFSKDFELFYIKPDKSYEKDDELMNFLKTVKMVIKNKNIQLLMINSSDEVTISFGDKTIEGKELFLKVWNQNNSNKIEFWEDFEKTLTAGGGYGQYKGVNAFIFPYYMAKFPYLKYDPVKYGVIIGENVNIRIEPTMDSKVLRAASYEIVAYDFYKKDLIWQKIGNDNYPWYEITTHDGKKGYIYGKFFGTNINVYRAYFIKKNGRWVLDKFVIGD